MDSDIVHDFSPFIRIYRDGRVERLIGTTIVPASLDESTAVLSKDVTISTDESNLRARLYIPSKIPITTSPRKLPLLVYFHGGGFCIESAQSPTYHNYLNSLVSEANVVVVSVEYRRAPENPIPIPYEDSWAALKWVGLHSGWGGYGPDEWLNSYVDFSRVFFAGDSAGANIAHRMAMMFGCEKIEGVDLCGVVLVNPYFLGSEPVGSEASLDPNKGFEAATFWKVMSPNSEDGVDDPVMNPAKDPNLSGLGCSKVLVVISELDVLKERGRYYGEVLRRSGWGGAVEVVEVKGEDHVFHLINPTCDNAVALMKRMVGFLEE